jgi:arylsulfatase A-like enzyme
MGGRRVTRKPWIVVVAALLACVLLAPSAQGAKKPASPPPNVVTIMTDDQDFRSMWAMPKTRRLLTRQGTTFQNNVVNYPLCCPSRATYYTGEYAHNHGILWNNYPEGGYYRFDGSETLPVWLQRAGYETIHIGKYLNEYGTRDPYEVPQGWSEWWGGVDPTTYDYYGYTLNHNGNLQTYGRSPEDYSTDVYAHIAEREIAHAARDDKPFFLNLAPNAPHTVAVEAEAKKEGTPAVPAPRDQAAAAQLEMPIYPNYNEADLSDKAALLAFFPQPFGEDVAASLARHYQGRIGSLFAVDDMVAGVHRALVRAGVADNTVIIFTSDNGWILGEHRLYDWVTQDGNASGVKYVPYEGSSRVPLVIAGPGFPHEKVEGVTVNADLAPTILRLAGAKSTLPRDGVSLLHAARHPDALDGRGVLIETGPNPRGVPPYKSIRTERYRLDVTAGGAFEGLFDLKRDPWELQSVHDDPRYAQIHDILGDALDQLATCRGKSCHIDLGKLPKPAP